MEPSTLDPTLEAEKPRSKAGLWQRLPVVVRATLASFAITVVLVLMLALFDVNRALLPKLPWSMVAIPLAYWVFWRYLDGHGWPRSTSDSRHTALRARPVKGPILTWSAVGGVLGGVWVLGLYLLALKTTTLPDEAYLTPPLLSGMAGWHVLLWSWLIALGAGLFEEAGFRGYMQGPLERRYGAPIAILFTSLIFSLIHLPQARVTMFTILAIVAGSLVLGVVAWASRSILPGVIVHAGIDSVSVPLRNFGVIPPRPYAETGVDGVLILSLVLSIPVGVAAVWALVRLSKLRLAEGSSLGDAET